MKKRLIVVLFSILSAGIIITGCNSKKGEKTPKSVVENTPVPVETVESKEEEVVEPEEELYNLTVKVYGANETGTIDGAEVKIKYDNMIEGNISSGDGTVKFTNLQPRDYVIECSADGYFEREFEIEITDSDKDYVVALVPELSNDDAIVLLTWEGDHDLDLCAFNTAVKEYVNIGHPIDSEENVFLYGDHYADEPYEAIYIHNASSEVPRTFYVTEAKNAREGASSQMEADGVSISIYTNKGLIYYASASKSQSAAIWIPCYFYGGTVYEQDEYVSDTTGDDFSWISYNEKDAYTEGDH